MALKGTIRDFGVADIFQLIGQQAKTGVLVMSNDVDQVRVYFREGAVVRAENVTRPEEMLFGNLMVRAAVITAEDLERALVTQTQTLKRLGSVLTELGYTDSSTIREFATLQTTETIYKLFEWRDGHYEFESTTVDVSPEGVVPIRADTIVMNGVRMMDEWPIIREKVPSYTWVIWRLKESPPDSSPTSDIDFSAFGDDGSLGPNEKTVLGLSTGRRTIQEVVDESRLGEFEACSAIAALVSQGYVRLAPARMASDDLAEASMTPGERVVRGLAITLRVGVSAALVMVLMGLVYQLRNGAARPRVFEPRVLERHWVQPRMASLRRALEVYRYEFGAYPERLEQLVEAELATERDLRFPFSHPYFYRVAEERYTLLPPIE
ncbi:MAG: DUF4388 domain-containing protein [Myxococcota bacterium]